MAYIRSLTTRSTLLKQQYRPAFTFSLHHQDHYDDHKQHNNSIDEFSYVQERGFRSKSSGSFNIKSFQEIRLRDAYSLSPSIGASFCRYMSTTTVGEGSDHKIELMSDVADVVITDTSAQSVAAASAVNEVAAAAADCFPPVAVLHHIIDAVHNLTGFNWWASIVLTTLVIRTLMVPLMINQLKATSKLTLMRPRLEEIKQQMQDTGMDPATIAEGNKQMKMLFKEYGVSPFTPMKGLFIQGPVFVCFFLAIRNMAENVPSFKNGGAFWFVDLSTPDSLYIFPVLTALTFWITIELNMQEGLEGNPVAGTMKNISRVFAALTVPLTMGFPKAIFCYWVTTNLFSFAYGGVLKLHGVKKFLGVPEIPVAPPSATSQSSFSLSSALKRALAAKQEPATSSSSPSDLSQKIQTLEKQVKGRKRNARR
ncbi:mitochondrial inner membrane protein OXA1 [Ricinus communis]|uniref:Cytochrome oxidase biogenesis protein, putative n=1 Tax=Ricinus communis TaxID=3988 RepID=B9SWW1_RICCO|nr:mitochondrial inner membrane protein OXA1 [Ricinus communis]EEF31903.1 cytochrome oxidase biogenesis protein, putative [Ricinus communis]|eukprot:XP_002530480.1 mitochondrial inner membrane protein OXA1 [Ricinus communis]